MKKLKIYISGQMTGIENYNFDKFFEVEKKLIQSGYEVINPARICLILSKKLKKNLDKIPREIFLKEDIKQLLNCDYIYMLKEWEKSNGAFLERKIAKELKIKIIEEK